MILALHRCIVSPCWTSTHSDTPTRVYPDKSLLMTEPTLIKYSIITLNNSVPVFIIVLHDVDIN